MTIMKLPHRKFLKPVGGAVAVPAVSRIVTAQTYLTRPVTMAVGFAAGSCHS
jgi:hypothetical protein